MSSRPELVYQVTCGTNAPGCRTVFDGEKQENFFANYARDLSARLRV